MRPHCGVCSQCIDRRFATLAAGLEQYDPTDRYNTEIFLGELKESNARTMAVSYVRFASEVLETAPEGLFSRFPELVEALDPSDPSQRLKAEALTDLLRRHSAAVIRVVEEQVRKAAPQLARREPPASCLLRSHISDEDAQGLGDFRTSRDYTVRQQPVSSAAEAEALNKAKDIEVRRRIGAWPPTAAAFVEILLQSRDAGTPCLRWKQISERLNARDYHPNRVHDVRRGVADWEKVVGSPRRGVYQLKS